MFPVVISQLHVRLILYLLYIHGDDIFTEIDECASDPCQNDGNCDDQVASYECSCSLQWTGTNCEGKEKCEVVVMQCGEGGGLP